MRLDYKLDSLVLQPLAHFGELLMGKARAKVRHRHLFVIDVVEVVYATVLVTRPVAHQLIAKQVIVLPRGAAAPLLQAHHPTIEPLCLLEVVHWYGQVEGIAGCV